MRMRIRTPRVMKKISISIPSTHGYDQWPPETVIFNNSFDLRVHAGPARLFTPTLPRYSSKSRGEYEDNPCGLIKCLV